ncbi:hypothetical protein Clacol_001390 [Clathrus columnatus]|uniref:Vacuolar membrane protein n=1 Tax=Clathrus columnatus TaxID=1419009 RepID=A0AAV5A2G3_9AGAM|nr:hypothetical protein Clacol_001390 [Clathrus columnatus]
MKNPYQPVAQLTELSSNDYTFSNVPVDKGQCLLLGPTALIVQGLMGVLVIASLVIKRYREKPMRPWRIWAFDVSKQVIGQAFVHGLNLLISDIVANISQGNPCDSYFLNVLLDTTLGLFAAWPGIFDMAEFLLSWTDGKDRLRIVFVMGIFPIIMNVLQFWLIDSIVKASASIQLGRSTDDSIRQPLFHEPTNDSDDEDREGEHIERRHDIESPPTPQKTQYMQNGNSNTEFKTTASGSSSTIVADSSSVQVHRYPPGPSYTVFGSSSVSPSSSSLGSPIATYRPKKSRRRSPPPPIRKPSVELSNGLHYTISSTPSPMPVKQFTTVNINKDNGNSTQITKNAPYLSVISPQSSVTPNSPWTIGMKDTDWAERVDQDDWTSKRFDKARGDLDLWSRQTILEVS